MHIRIAIFLLTFSAYSLAANDTHELNGVWHGFIEGSQPTTLKISDNSLIRLKENGSGALREKKAKLAIYRRVIDGGISPEYVIVLSLDNRNSQELNYAAIDKNKLTVFSKDQKIVGTFERQTNTN